MGDSVITVLQPPVTRDLVTLSEMKTMLGITDTTEDAQLQILITNYSDMIAELCNREFAKAKVEETVRGDLMPYDSPRVFLTYYPVKQDDLETVLCNGATVSYHLEEKSGKINLFGPVGEPIVVTYTGGYLVPDETPPALKQAMQMFVQADRRIASQEVTSGLRMIAHRESRIMFHPPSKTESGGTSSGLSTTMNAVKALLTHYMRINV